MPSEEISAILQALERFSGEYEREAVDAAIVHREEITPHLIECLGKVAAHPAAYLEDKDYYLFIYAFMLLGHFHETRAHRAIVELFSLPDDIPDKLFGDLLTEYLPVVLFNTCDGDFDLIKSLVLNRQADPFARGGAARALAYAVAAGKLPREEVLSFFSTLFTGDEAEPRSEFWGLIANSILDLYPKELLPLIEAADEKGLLDGSFLVCMEDVTRALQGSVESSLAKTRREMERYSLDDLHSQMASWNCFGDGYWEPYMLPPDTAATEDPKAKKKKKKRQQKTAKASRRKNRR